MFNQNVLWLKQRRSLIFRRQITVCKKGVSFPPVFTYQLYSKFTFKSISNLFKKYTLRLRFIGYCTKNHIKINTRTKQSQRNTSVCLPYVLSIFPFNGDVYSFLPEKPLLFFISARGDLPVSLQYIL